MSQLCIFTILLSNSLELTIVEVNQYQQYGVQS